MASSNDSNLWGALSYLVMPITSVLALLVKGEDKYVKFHAWQGLVLGIVLFVINIVLGMLSFALAFVPVLGWVISLLVGGVFSLVCLVLWLYCMWKAYQGEKFKLPVLGDFAEGQVNK